MSALSAPALSAFAQEVLEGLSNPLQKQLSPAYLYDELGSVLFEAITLLPEYGLTRADERLLSTHSDKIVRRCRPDTLVAELGSGSGRKTRSLLSSLREQQGLVDYCPIDVSKSALVQCRSSLEDLANVMPIHDTWLSGLHEANRRRQSGAPMLILFLGSSIGNIARAEIPSFLESIRSALEPGDLFLLGADLMKPVLDMLTAYDDPTGVTSAFNLNLLARMNRELGANFDLRSFVHQARWCDEHRRIEMHLASLSSQTVYIDMLQRSFAFQAGESIWTESSHKFTIAELDELASAGAFQPIESWLDADWPFAEVLWEAAIR